MKIFFDFLSSQLKLIFETFFWVIEGTLSRLCGDFGGIYSGAKIFFCVCTSEKMPFAVNLGVN